MKKINIISLLITLLITITLLGCGNNTGGGGNQSGTKKRKQKESAGELYINLNKAGYGTSWIDDAIEGFEEEYNIKVYVSETPDLANELKRLLDQKVANKSKNILVDDIYFAGLQPSDWLPWTEYGKTVLQPLETLKCVEKLDPEIRKWGSRTVKGQEHLYALHPNIALETFVYNEEYLKKIPSNGEYNQGVWPTTWQGLLDLCEELVVNMDSKIDGKKVYPYAIFLEADFEPQKLYETLFAQGNGGKDYMDFFNFDINRETPNDDDKNIFANYSFADAMWALDEFLNVDKMDGTSPIYYKNYQGGTAGSGDVEAIKGFLQGEALFCWHGSFFETEAKYLIEAPTINKIGNNYAIGVVPAISGNEKDRTINLNWPHENIIVPNFAENVDNALLFLDYIYRDENLINIVKAMNAIPGFEHTYTESEKASLSKWGKNVIEVYEKFSNKENYPNGISFRNSTSRVYRGAVLNSLNFNSAGEGIFFAYLHCTQEEYRKNSKEEYYQLLVDLYEKGIKAKKWSEWVERFPV